MASRHLIASPAAIATLCAIAATGAVADASASWRWPVHGPIGQRFSALERAPFAAGRHRGIGIVAAPGSVVRSACAGRVAFAGSVGRTGRTISVSCGALRATYQGLAELRVAAGAVVGPATPLASVGRGGLLLLGARRVEPGRTGPARYVDPLRLLSDRQAGPPPVGRAPRRAPGDRRPAPPRPAPRPADPAPVPVPVPSPGVPLLVWVGLALVAVGAPCGALARRRPDARRARAPAPVPRPVRR